MRLIELPLSAQTAYAELFSQVKAFELNGAMAGLVGAFHKRELKGRAYWYFGYRDMDQKLRMAYVGPDSDRVQALVRRFEQTRSDKPLAAPARMAIAAGCTPLAPKHFRVIRRLADYGFFRAGGVLVGTHAFLALGNMLGVRWSEGATASRSDFTDAGRNVSVALSADFWVDVRCALESLETGQLPLTQFNGKVGAQDHGSAVPSLQLDFITPVTCSGRQVVIPGLNVAVEPLKFLEFSVATPLQACIFSNLGACIVNLPAPERYAVHKLMVYGERPVGERSKASKDLLQAASLASYFLLTGQAAVFNAAWQEALGCAKGWEARAVEGKAALLQIAPELDHTSLWQA